MAHSALPGYSERANDTVVYAFISNHSTFTVECPRCMQSEVLSVRNLPPAHPNPVQCTCSCGATFRVRLVGFRASHRKPVKLAASFVPLSETPGIKGTCAVDDLSVTGLRFMTERMKNNLSVGQVLKICIFINGRRPSKLELPAVVRRVIPGHAAVTVGVEFLPLGESVFRTLQRCTTS